MDQYILFKQLTHLRALKPRPLKQGNDETFA